MPPIRTSRHRNWVFTLNNPDLDNLPKDVQGAAFLAYQIEKGAGGTPHAQGLVCFDSAITFSSAKRRIDASGAVHIEVMKGAVSQALHYCSKPVNNCDCEHCTTARLLPNGGVIRMLYAEGVEPVGQGRRTDIVQVFEAVRGGDTELAIAEAFPGAWCKNRSSISAYRSLLIPPRSEQTKALVYWGPPLSGKSRKAALHDPDGFWLSRPNARGGNLWWDGYSGQNTVVIDEFYGWMPRSDCQRLIDRTPFQVQTKGGSARFTSELVIFTSNVHPSDWWRNIGLGAMARRLADPVGSIEYIGNDEFPTGDSWRNSEEYASSHLSAPNAIPGGNGAISTNLRV